MTAVAAVAAALVEADAAVASTVAVAIGGDDGDVAGGGRAAVPVPDSGGGVAAVAGDGPVWYGGRALVQLLPGEEEASERENARLGAGVPTYQPNRLGGQVGMRARVGRGCCAREKSKESGGDGGSKYRQWEYHRSSIDG